MKMADAKQKRNEQLKRWIGSETDLEPPVVKRKKTKVKFDDGAVFLAACSSGDTEEVLRLLERGADINYANVDGLTALHQVRAGGGGGDTGQGAAAGPSRGWRTGDGAGAPPGARSAGAASPEGVSPPSSPPLLPMGPGSRGRLPAAPCGAVTVAGGLLPVAMAPAAVWEPSGAAGLLGPFAGSSPKESGWLCSAVGLRRGEGEGGK